MKKTFRKCLAGFIAVMMLMACVTPVTFAAYTDANNTPILFESDFSDWEPSDTLFDGEELATLSNGKVTGDADSVYGVNPDGSLTFYEPITASDVQEPKTVGASMKLDFGKSIAAADLNSDVIVDFDIKKEPVKVIDASGELVDATAGTGGQRTIGFYYTDEEGTTSSIKAFQMDDLGNLERAVGTNPFYGSASPAIAVDGYYSLRMVLAKDEYTCNGSGNTEAAGGSAPFYDFKWSVKIYDKNNDNALVFTHRYLEESETAGYALFKGISGLNIGTYSSKNYAKTNQYQMTVKNPTVKVDGFEALVDETNTIAVGSTSLDVEFNRNVDMTTVEDYITFEKDGENVLTGAVTNGNVVTLYFPAVQFGDTYSLNILNGLKSVDPVEDVFPASFDYEAVVENQSNIIFEKDFASWDVEEGEVITDNGILELSGGNIKSSGHTYSVSNGDLVAQRKVALGTASTSTYMNFAEQKLDGLKNSIVFETDIKATSGDIYNPDTKAYRQITDSDTLGGSSSRGFQIMGTDSNGGTVGRALFGVGVKGAFTKPADSANTYKVGGISTPTVGTNGYWSLKIELIPGKVTVGSTEYAWTVKVYDKNNNNNAFHTFYYTAAELASVNGVNFNVYEDSGARNLNIYSRWTIKNPVAYINGLKLVVPEEKKISIADKVLDLEFTKEVERTTVEENVLLLDKDGNNVVQGAVPDGKNVKLYLGDIKIGDTYKLYVLGGLADTDGAFAYTSVTEFTVEYVEPNLVLFEEDFSKWDVEENVAISAGNVGTYSGGTIIGSNNEYFIEDGALVATRPAASGQSAYNTVFKFNKAITAKTAISDIEINFDLKKEGNMTAETVDGVTTFSPSETSNGGSRSIFFDGLNSDGGAKQAYLFSIDGSGNLVRIANGSWASSYGQVAPAAATADEDDFYSLKFVISNGEYVVGNNTYAWMVNVYDKNADEKCLLTYYYKADELATINGFGEIKYTDGSSRGAGFLRSVFKNIKAEFVPFESIEPVDTVLEAKQGVLEIAFNMDLDDATLDAITLKDKNGDTVSTKVESEANNAYVYFNELNIGDEYILDINYTLKGKKGASVKPVSYTYSVVEAKPLVDIDFTEMNEAEYTSANIADIDKALALVSANTTATVENGNLKVNIPKTGGNMSEGITISAPAEIKSGVVVTELKLMVEEASTEAGDAFRKIGLSAGNIGRISSLGNKIVRNSNVSNADFTTYLPAAAYGEPEFVTEMINGAEYIDIKIVASRATESDYWTIAVYDNNDETVNTAKIFTKGGTGAFDKLILDVYRDKAARDSNSNNPVTIKSVKMYKENSEDVTFLGLAGTNKNYSLNIDGNTVTWTGTIYSRTNDGTKNKAYIAAYGENDVLLGINTIELGGFDNSTITIEVANGTVTKAILYVWDAGLKPITSIKK